MSARSQVLEDTEVYEQRNPRRAMQTRTRETKGWYQTADLRTLHRLEWLLPTGGDFSFSSDV